MPHPSADMETMSRHYLSGSTRFYVESLGILREPQGVWGKGK